MKKLKKVNISSFLSEFHAWSVADRLRSWGKEVLWTPEYPNRVVTVVAKCTLNSSYKAVLKEGVPLEPPLEDRETIETTNIRTWMIRSAPQRA